MPSSMRESTILVLPKEGKDLLDPASYVPIALLYTDVKKLAKILAVRLKKNNSFQLDPAKKTRQQLKRGKCIDQ